MLGYRAGVASSLAVLGLLIGACSFGPPPSCGEDIGGTADTAAFDKNFTSMALVNQSTGQSAREGENGMEFAQGDNLAIQLDAKSKVTVRACIQPRSGGNAISFDETQTFSQGQGAFAVGAFEPGAYVIRVIVDNTLVKNFPFVTQ